jgi:hypothetical protein
MESPHHPLKLVADGEFPEADLIAATSTWDYASCTNWNFSAAANSRTGSRKSP